MLEFVLLGPFSNLATLLYFTCWCNLWELIWTQRCRMLFNEWSHLVSVMHFLLGLNYDCGKKEVELTWKHNNFTNSSTDLDLSKGTISLKTPKVRSSNSLTVFLTFRKNYKGFSLYKSLDDTLYDIIPFQAYYTLYFSVGQWVSMAWAGPDQWK